MAKNALFLISLFLGVLTLLVSVFPKEAEPPEKEYSKIQRESFQDILQRVDHSMAANWQSLDLEPMKSTSELQVARRLAISLMGTLPSLEEIRQLEAQPEGKRIEWYLHKIFSDRRYADYMAERLTRATVGVKEGPFLVYRRRRYRAWLSEQLAKNTPYGQMVREMIDTTGLWTDKPATNFLTVEILPDTDVPRPAPLAGRVARTFVGIRMDCAECHDHPFERWKQKDFHGLAAYFSHSRNSILGIHDLDVTGKKARWVKKKREKGEKNTPISEYMVEQNGVKTTYMPQVPFHKDLLPETGTRRSRLATWLTHKDNDYFARATVNRFWALIFGRPLLEPVDDLPAKGPYPPPLEVLAKDFAENNYDLHRLITIIALSKAFSLDSKSDPDDPDAPEMTEDHSLNFAAFPLTQLRPEQVIGGLIQSSSLPTIDTESFWLWRLIRVTQENDFLKRYGDMGEDKFESGVGTIPQRLLLMNGKIARERIKGDILNASGHIAMLTRNDAQAIEAMWLCIFSRRPSPEELEHFEAKLTGLKGDKRKRALEDIHWTLVNSTEFSWNH
ncbi:MAG: DUF1549 domain-containing protein [Planctomycetota bacterium]|nr:DUF1549 domain-containing protein [Planctomycetota bacterium]